MHNVNINVPEAVDTRIDPVVNAASGNDQPVAPRNRVVDEKHVIIFKDEHPIEWKVNVQN